jgi:hypothetical protein
MNMQITITQITNGWVISIAVPEKPLASHFSPDLSAVIKELLAMQAMIEVQAKSNSGSSN